MASRDYFDFSPGMKKVHDSAHAATNIFILFLVWGSIQPAKSVLTLVRVLCSMIVAVL
jgi:hypothetical protein